MEEAIKILIASLITSILLMGFATPIILNESTDDPNCKFSDLKERHTCVEVCVDSHKFYVWGKSEICHWEESNVSKVSYS